MKTFLPTSPSPLRTLVALVATLTLAVRAPAETRWHEHSMHLYLGQVNSAATIYGRGNYGKLDLGSDAERGIGYTVQLKDDLDLEFALGQVHSSGTQHGRTGSGDEADRLYVDLQLTSLYITGKQRYEPLAGLFVPWVGAGLNADLLETEETETVMASGGSITKPRTMRSSSAVGVHGVAGIDMYPRKTSAVALSVQFRYDLTLLERGPFDGEIGGFGLLFGLRWDFFADTL